MIKMETDRRAVPLDDTKCCHEVLWGADQSAVIQMSCVQSEIRDLLPDMLYNGMEREGEIQQAQRVTLLHPTAAEDGVLTQAE